MRKLTTANSANTSSMVSLQTPWKKCMHQYTRLFAQILSRHEQTPSLVATRLVLEPNLLLLSPTTSRRTKERFPKSNVPAVSSKSCLLVASRASTKQHCHFIAQSISLVLDWWQKVYSFFMYVYVCKSSCIYIYTGELLATCST